MPAEAASAPQIRFGVIIAVLVADLPDRKDPLADEPTHGEVGQVVLDRAVAVFVHVVEAVRLVDLQGQPIARRVERDGPRPSMCSHMCRRERSVSW